MFHILSQKMNNLWNGNGHLYVNYYFHKVSFIKTRFYLVSVLVYTNVVAAGASHQQHHHYIERRKYNVPHYYYYYKDWYR